MKGIPARVTDFGLRGMLRIVLKPLISEIPLVGGVQAYFLKVKKYLPEYIDLQSTYFRHLKLTTLWEV